MCFPHGSTQTWTVTSDAAALGGTASQTAASGGRHNSAAAGGLNVPPAAARSERSERPTAATAATKGGLRRQNARFVKPSRQSRCKGGAGGVVRSDKEAAELCRLNRETAARAERTARPQNPCRLLAGWRHSPSAAEESGRRM